MMDSPFEVLTTFKNVNGHSGLFKTEVAATVFSKSEPTSFNLPLARLVPQLCYELMDHAQPGCAHGVAARLQAARGVNRNFTPKPSGPAFSEGSTFTDLAKPQGFALVDLAESCGIVHFSCIDILRADPGDLVRSSGEPYGYIVFQIIMLPAAS
jgi:hypothetical protein